MEPSVERLDHLPDDYCLSVGGRTFQFNWARAIVYSGYFYHCHVNKIDPSQDLNDHLTADQFQVVVNLLRDNQFPVLVSEKDHHDLMVLLERFDIHLQPGWFYLFPAYPPY